MLRLLVTLVTLVALVRITLRRVLRFDPVLPTEIFIANTGSDSVLVFGINAEGNVPPARVIQGSLLTGSNNTTLATPNDIAIDRRGRVVVSSLGNASTPRGVAVFNDHDSGNVAPRRALSVPGPPLGVAGIESDGGAGQPRIFTYFVLVGLDLSEGLAGPHIVEYSGTDGVDTITGEIHSTQPDGLLSPTGVAVDTAANVFVADAGRDAVLVFTAPINTVSVVPPVMLSGPHTLLNQPSRLALDVSGNLYVTNLGNASITVYSATARGDAAPTRRIGGPEAINTRMQQPQGIIVDVQGRIYVANGGSVLVFAADANGDVAPIREIKGEDTGLNFALGVALH